MKVKSLYDLIINIIKLYLINKSLVLYLHAYYNLIQNLFLEV